MTVLERLTKLIVNRFGVSEETITMETSFKDDLGADSLEIVELIMELEDEFEMEVPDEAAEGLTTIGAVVSYIEKTNES